MKTSVKNHSIRKKMIEKRNKKIENQNMKDEKLKEEDEEIMSIKLRLDSFFTSDMSFTEKIYLEELIASKNKSRREKIFKPIKKNWGGDWDDENLQEEEW